MFSSGKDGSLNFLLSCSSNSSHTDVYPQSSTAAQTLDGNSSPRRHHDCGASHGYTVKKIFNFGSLSMIISIHPSISFRPEAHAYDSALAATVSPGVGQKQD